MLFSHLKRFKAGSYSARLGVAVFLQVGRVMLIPHLIGTSLLVLTLGLSASAEVIQFYSFRDGKRIANDDVYNKGFADTAKDIDKYGLGKPKINVIVVPEAENASFDLGTTINIPRTMIKRNYYGSEVEYKSTIETQAVFAHEYAHAVLDFHLDKVFTNYANLKKLTSEISERSLRPLINQMSPQALKENADAIAKLKEKYDSDSTLRAQNHLIAPYQELFADVVAVFVNDNPTIIMNALYPPLSNNGHGFIPIHDQPFIQGAEGRSFSIMRDPLTWDYLTPHLFFSPVRSIIGSKECWPTTQADKIKKLNHLVKIITEQIKEKDKAKAQALASDNVTIINKYKTICK